MTDAPREYDREYLKPLPGPIQLRFGLNTHRGTVTRFMVQLEYWINGEWSEVVRYDHDPEAAPEMAHDVTAEGLHVDIYRDGEKADTERVTGPLPAGEAFNRAEEHLTQHLQAVVRRFEQWHGMQNP